MNENISAPNVEVKKKKKKKTKMPRVEVVMLVFRFEQNGNPNGSLEELFFFFPNLNVILSIRHHLYLQYLDVSTSQ